VWEMGVWEYGGWNNLPYEFPITNARSSSIRKM
jgi:hypothetical protein